jgi:multicomponent K+:H+ antiporter subunit F
MILTAALNFALLAFGLALIMNLVRLFTAPTVTDRILALDTMTVNTLGIIVLYGVRSGSSLTFEVAILFALTGFISTVALCRFLLRGSIIE